jgi:hypothetical protein
LHRAYSSVVLVLGLLACASGGQRAALGWSLGGEAHVFVPGDRFARQLFQQLTGSGALAESLAHRPLIAVEGRGSRGATVLSASGAAPARLTLARFHAPQTCRYDGMVTELVLAFPPGGTAGRSTPRPNVAVVALLDAPPFAGTAAPSRPALSRAASLELVNRVVRHVDSSATLVRPLVLDADQSADAGEVVVAGTQYAVGFRARMVSRSTDTALVTGVALTDPELKELRWVVRPQRTRLVAGVMPSGSTGKRYSLRGALAVQGNEPLLLLDEIADDALRDSRATAVDGGTRRVIAAQPLALRCP